ncbi:unnamed protein product [Didymodactylos carnosus]|uniref:VWFA domain-containing protein n=1 Tax=Didymodactylos carnosus TaxID=1234261 RepID=A0A8S2I3S7_9BILA|nr:unnamed protein product [Didymodactylos carnosus]CAF3708346.1 unnamed protein product [Didymodactylos carnosus]
MKPHMADAIDTIRRIIDELLPPTTRELLSPTTRALLSPTTRALLSPTTRALLSPTTRALLSPTTRELVPATTRDLVLPTTRELVPETTRINARFAFIEYEDHPPSNTRFVTHVHNFTNSVEEMRGWLNQCRAVSGGDGPEAVADALNDALNLSWNSDATKICILIADAPPHGIERNGDVYPRGCPCGHDPIEIVEKMKEEDIILYIVGVENPIMLYRGYYEDLARRARGEYVSLLYANRLAPTIINDVNH